MNSYELLGRVTYQWNRIERWWHLIFVQLVELPRDQADALYLSPRSIETQLRMTLAIADLRLKVGGDAKVRLADVHKRTRTAQKRRNEAIHARYIGGASSPNLYVERARSDARSENVVSELRESLDTFTTLANDTWTALAAVSVELGRDMP